MAGIAIKDKRNLAAADEPTFSYDVLCPGAGTSAFASLVWLHHPTAVTVSNQYIFIRKGSRKSR